MSKFKRSYRGFTRQAAAWLFMAGLLIGCTPVVAPTGTAGGTLAPDPNSSVSSPPARDPSTPVVAPATTLTPISTDDPTVEPEEAPTRGAGKAPIDETGAAVVEQVELRILESFPVQVHAVISGYLPDGCTKIRGTEVVNEGTTFRIRMSTSRPANAMCTMVITPFEEVVPLDVSEMPAGVYQVAVNDRWAEFELP